MEENKKNETISCEIEKSVKNRDSKLLWSATRKTHDTTDAHFRVRYLNFSSFFPIVLGVQPVDFYVSDDKSLGREETKCTFCVSTTIPDRTTHIKIKKQSEIKRMIPQPKIPMTM